MKDAQVIKKLEKDIRRHRLLYYNEQPEITDPEFDELVDRLEALSPNSEVLSEVGAEIDGKNKVEHKFIMGSLEKCNTKAEADAWLAKNEVTELVLEEKLDGAGLDVMYLDGKLVRLTTRGNGYVGADVTHHKDAIIDLPKTIDVKTEVFVRGEAIIHISHFNKLNAELPDDEKKANPRNLASGTLNSDEAMPERKLHFVATAVIGLNSKEEMNDITFMVKNKFKPVKSMIVTEMISDLLESFRNGYIEEHRAKLDYMIDGLVLKINQKRVQEELGYKRKKPNWAIAYKFPAEEVTTVLEDVEWNLSNTGILAPKAKLKPVQLAGTTVKAAYLHNIEYIKDMGIKIGDTVSIKKAGDIIPQVVAKISNGNKRKEINPPVSCPSCKTELEMDGKFVKCLNNSCPDKALGVLDSYIKTLKIDELGDKALLKLVEAGLVKTPADLYRLKSKDAEELIGKNGLKIVKNVLDSKKMKLPVLFAAVMISGSGKTSFEEIVKFGFNTVDKILNLTVEQLCEVPGFQTTKAEKIVEGLAQRKEIILDLMNYITIEEKVVKSGALNGLSFMFTGSMSKSRDEMSKIVEDNGGSTMSVKKGLSYLVAEDPDESGGKLEKARKLSINIISEEQFWELLNG